MRIKWNNVVTGYFTISISLKQGWCAVTSIVQSVVEPAHIVAQTYWYGLLQCESFAENTQYFVKRFKNVII